MVAFGKAGKATLGLLLSGLLIASAEAQDGPDEVIEIQLEHQQVVSPLQPIRIIKGDTVELRWTSDEPIELHLHGYDLTVPVEAGEPSALTFEAYATGRFPITSHGQGGGSHGYDALTYLEVYPR